MMENKIKQQDKPKKRLGDILLEKGLITEEQLNIALQVQKSTKRLLGDILIFLGFIDQAQISSVLSTEFGVQYFNSLSDIVPDPEALKLIPQEFAQKFKVVPLHVEDDKLTVIVDDPFNVTVIDELKKLTDKTIITAVAPIEEIEQAIDNWYTDKLDIDSLIQSALESLGTATVEVEEPPIIKLVNYIISTAIKRRATDIHIEPEKNAVVLRYRVDGILHVVDLFPKDLGRVITTRIKIISGLDISESRIPQDGRANFIFAGRSIDLRVSTFPINEGENIVLRILDKSKLVSKVEALGFSEKQVSIFRKLLNKKYGIILVTGPTGSGKTTTLYAALLEVNSTKVNIMTIEDPIEYELPFIRQSQINEKAGFDFAKGLRSILRQDPDIIMVGEIRDEETISVATHAALTGHLVLSTLHTNSALAAIPRLKYMGISSNILASALGGVIAQRLVRLICPYCKEEYEATPEEIKLIEEQLPDFTRGETISLAKGKGCDRCNFTGFMGRTAISEVFEVDKEIARAIEKNLDDNEINKLIIKKGFITMAQDGIMKALEKITSLDEVMRVV